MNMNILEPNILLMYVCKVYTGAEQEGLNSFIYPSGGAP